MNRLWNTINCNKNALIVFKDKQTIRGAYTECYRFSLSFPNFSLYTIEDLKDLSYLDECDNVILCTQAPHYYSKYEQIKIIRDYYNYVRPLNIKKYRKPITNGFSIYKEVPGYIGYFPMIYKPEYDIINKDTDTITIGYYHRPQRDVMFSLFNNFISNINRKVRIFIMNTGNKPSFYNKNITEIQYTNDAKYFWSNVTHYFYGLDNYIDPWPTTLQEAVNFNKQIIIIGNKQKFNDGKNDILNCIKYHSNLNDIYYNNSSSILNTIKYDKIYKDSYGYLPKELYFNEYLERYL